MEVPASSLFKKKKKKKLSKHYQKCDIKNGEENFAQRTGDISPVESEPWAAKLIHEHQLRLLL